MKDSTKKMIQRVLDEITTKVENLDRDLHLMDEIHEDDSVHMYLGPERCMAWLDHSSETFLASEEIEGLR